MQDATHDRDEFWFLHTDSPVRAFVYSSLLKPRVSLGQHQRRNSFRQ
jgi:hypothetical protein